MSGPRDGVETLLVHAGRRPEWTHGLINPPVARASTFTFATLAEHERACADPHGHPYYATHGTPTQWALQEALSALEPGAGGTMLYPSGMAAVAGALLSVLKSGDHLLMVDSVYGPTRRFCREMLDGLGIETTYYDPLIGAGIAELMRPNTRVLFLESPGSHTFEVQDLPTLIAEARARGVTTILDNTWATPLRLRAIALGVDLSVQALSKYIGGHADLLAGAVTAAPAAWPRLRDATIAAGFCLSPDDSFLVSRGLRSLAVRLDRHEASALAVARYLDAHPLVARVLHPALPSCPGHAHFAASHSGSSGLFAFTLRRPGKGRLAAMLDHMRLFAIGFSFGGFESLALPVNPKSNRTATKWEANGPTIRLSVGLEDPADLTADLESGLARYEAALP